MLSDCLVPALNIQANMVSEFNLNLLLMFPRANFKVQLELHIEKKISQEERGFFPSPKIPEFC